MHTHTHDEPRGLDCLRAYVSGESAEPDLASCMRTLPRAEARRMLKDNSEELDQMNAARRAILDSLL